MFTEVSGKRTASVFRISEIAKQEAGGKQSIYQTTSVESQMILLFTIIFVRNSDLAMLTSIVSLLALSQPHCSPSVIIFRAPAGPSQHQWWHCASPQQPASYTTLPPPVVQTLWSDLLQFNYRLNITN
jgi:hypothetical protein